MKVWKGLAVNLFLGCCIGFMFIYFADENGIALSISFVGFILSAHIIQMQVSYLNISNSNTIEFNHAKQASKTGF